MDDTDRALIRLLRRNARRPHVELARELGVSRATVQNRLRRLEKNGDIVGYTVRLRAELAPAPVRALISVTADARREADIVRRIETHPAIAAIHHTTGRWDLIAEVGTATLAEFHRLVGEIRALPGVTSTESNLLLDSQTYAGAGPDQA
ncbi:MAG: Lrp/AsnC family transcriptional regulator [Pseudomonadota bacterium]